MAFVPDEAVGRLHELTGRETKVLVYICMRADKAGACYPSLRRTAADLKLDHSDVARARCSLVRKGFISFDPFTGITTLLVGSPRAGNGGGKTPPRVVVKQHQGGGNVPPGGGGVLPPKVVAKHPQGGGKTPMRYIRTEPAHEPAHITSPLEERHVELPAATTTALLPGVDFEAELVTRQHTANATTARAVFDYWRVTLNHPRARFDNKRQRAVLARLKDGFTLGQLKAAVDGLVLSGFHMGANDTGTVYDDLALICRDAAHVEGFINKGDTTDGLQRQERQAPLTANSQRLLASFAGIARRAATEAGSDDTGGQDFTGLTLLR